jgi:hypothetical protein
LEATSAFWTGLSCITNRPVLLLKKLFWQVIAKALSSLRGIYFDGIRTHLVGI